MIFRNLKIANRLIIGYFVILLMFLVTGYFSFNYISKIWQNEQNLYDHPFMVSNGVREIKIGILNIRRYMLHMALDYQPETIKTSQNFIEQEEEKTIKQFEKVLESYLGDKQEIVLFQNNFTEWKNIRDNAFYEFNLHNTDKARELILVSNKTYVDSLLTEADKVIEFANNKASQFYNSSIKSKDDSIKTLVFLLVLSIFISLLLAFLITRSIISPLKLVVSSIEEISRGKISNKEIPISKDEIGQLAYSFNLMQLNLVDKVKVLELISKGNFDERVTVNNSSDALAIIINKIANDFDLVVKQSQRVAKGDFELHEAEYSPENKLGTVIGEMLKSLKEVVESARRVSLGDYSGEILPKSESDELALALNQMNKSLMQMSTDSKRQDKLKTSINELNGLMRGDLDTETLAKNAITYIAKFTQSKLGVIYLVNTEKNAYKLVASYAYKQRKGNLNEYRDGEGLIGQATLEKEIITFSNIPDDYITVSSGLGESRPRNIVVVPLVYSNKVVGVYELGSMNEFTEEDMEFIQNSQENIAIAVLSAINRTEMSLLLQRMQEMTEELQVQQEELRQSNEELEEQTKALKKSEEFLQAQQEELRVTNEELEEKTKYLENQKGQIEKQNNELEKAQKELEKRAHELETTNKYKSEFLANMSHELRTPLNSLLILSQSLAENKKGNLNSEQVESAQIIYNSGNDLLNLINDILDLSKIESGKMKLNFETVVLQDLISNLKLTFQHMMKQKGIEFKLNIYKGVPQEIITDPMRLNQVLRNLIANAIKFTEKGSVEVILSTPSAHKISFTVKDTGIGIAKEKQQAIFEAFQQADGSISRKYGGTGLGLSVSKEIIKLLGGEIKLISEPGIGSEFTIVIPVNQVISETESQPLVKDLPKPLSETPVPIINKKEFLQPSSYEKIPSITDERNSVTSTDKVVLIVEDDIRFAQIVADMCRNKGFKCLATSTGEEALVLAEKFKPQGIILDINLPGIDGWQVLESLKNKAETRHIPVHIMSGFEGTIDAFNKGAIGYLTKPITKDKLGEAFDHLESFITKKIKDLLIIEDDENLRKSIKVLLNATDLNITECSSGLKAIELIQSNRFDCVVLDLGLPDMSGFDLLRNLRESIHKIPPIVVYTGKEITREENDELMQYTQNIIIKGVRSNERLLDETALFLHRVVGEMPDMQKQMLINLYDKDKVFEDKKILVVDDDMRNVFALTQVLENSKMKVIMAPNGQKAIDELNKNPDVDLVLMDIMMPVMDGYEAMKRIRVDAKFKKLPIIALTAKAMKEDREKSLESGASDYLSKPVDVQKLFNLMRIWLYQ